MAVIRGLIAASLDGYVADLDGGVEWLAPFVCVEHGYANFIDQIGTVVMGRRTYDLIPSLGIGWPYAGKRALVLTSGRGSSVRDRTRFWTDGLPALIAYLSALDDGDVWVVGGGRLMAGMIEAGALDRLELLVAPVLLGEGRSLFPKSRARPRGMRLNGVEALERGVVLMDYALGVEPVVKRGFRTQVAQPQFSSPEFSGPEFAG
jgi:dihydrofolate reductase